MPLRLRAPQNLNPNEAWNAKPLVRSIARNGVEEGISGELLATDLRAAQYHLGAITGKITVEDLLGSIFSKLYQFALHIHPIYLLFFRMTSPRRSPRSSGYATTSSDRPAKK